MVLIDMTTSFCIGSSGGLPKNTNNPLPEAQKREMQAAILAEQEAIRLIDVEISQFQSGVMVDELRSRRKVKDDLVALLKILVSPMKDLPNEIIARIFEQYAYGPLPHPSCDDPCPPWYLGHICSRWRAVALSIPSLWNFFVVNLDELIGSDSRSFDIARYLLLRTGQSHFSCIAKRDDPDSADIADLFDLFSSHTNRLRYLKIDGVDDISSLEEIPEAPLRSLEVLDLSVYDFDDSSENIDPSSITLFNDTPNLRRVSIYTNMDQEYSDPLLLGLPWHQLTHLHITNSGFPAFQITHALLLQCPNLVESSLNIPEDIHNSLALPIIRLQHLESLRLSSKGSGEYGELLQYLSAPCLKRLALASEHIESSWSSDDVVDFIRRSECKIEALKCSFFLSRLFILEILNETPSLKRLSMGGSEMLPELIAYMIWNPFLMELRWIQAIDQSLMYTMEELKRYADDPEFDQLVSKRLKPLGIFLVVQHPFEEDDWTTELCALSVKGLEIDLRRWEDKGFMDCPDDKVFDESHCTYSTEVEYW